MATSNDNIVKTSDFAPPLRVATHPSQVIAPLRPPPPLKYEKRLLEDGRTILEKDVAIPMRDGVKIYADLYRPKDEIFNKTPTIVLFSPFGKHGAVPPNLFKNMGVDFSKLSKYTLWELPDPYVWCPEHGYSLLNVDARGTWWSEGEAAYFFSPEEGRDGYDIVEWIAQQSWNTGKVGWGAVSYFAMSTYQMAALKPPHLAAIMAWEGLSDLYREVNVVGGIPSTSFQYFWMSMTGNGLSKSEDASTASLEQPTFTPYWASKVVDWSKIDVPAFSVTNWSSLQLHLRGTIAAWKEFSSKNKYLWVHTLREWEAYYSDDGIRRQKAFWDRFLKDQPNEVDYWSPVEIYVRESLDRVVEKRSIAHWPPTNSKITSFHLGANGALQLGTTGGDEPAYVSYISHHRDSYVKFDYVFPSRTEITGDSSLKLFVQTLQLPDTDLHVAIQKIGTDGKEYKFFHQTQKPEASAGHGWLRASHREKHPEKSRPGRPYHIHQRRQWLRQIDIEEVEVEIWPSSTVWEKGDTLRIVVQGQPFFDQESPVASKIANSHSFGEVRVWFGGKYDSQLYLPVVE